MESRNTITTELINIAPALQQLPKQVPYKMPEHYFNHFLGLVNDKKIISFPAVKTPYQLPEHYFDQFYKQVYTSIHQPPVHELNEVAPLLVQLSRQMPYTTPPQYVSTHLIMQGNPQPARVISFKHWLQYAAAACFACVLITAAVVWQKNWRKKSEEIAKSEIRKQINKLSDKELETYLTTETNYSTIIEQHDSLIYIPTEAVTEHVEKQLEEYSDEELRKYLKENDVQLPRNKSGS